jgi:hypothetical protein
LRGYIRAGKTADLGNVAAPGLDILKLHVSITGDDVGAGKSEGILEPVRHVQKGRLVGVHAAFFAALDFAQEDGG